MIRGFFCALGDILGCAGLKSSSKYNTASINSRFFPRLSSLLISLWLLTSASALQAEFLDTPGGVLFHTDKQLVVITVSSGDTTGFFFSFSAKSTQLQLYDPTALSEDNDQSFFVRFDLSQHRFSEIIRGTNTYRIRGSLTINMGSARISIDNNLPYLTVVAERADKPTQPDIIGFVGLNRVLNGSGRALAAIFEANQLSELKGIVEPYDLKDGALHLHDSEIASRIIGFELQPSVVECLNSDAIILNTNELQNLQHQKSESEKEVFLRTLVLKHNQSSPLQGLLVLHRARESDDASLLFDYKNSKAQTLKLISKSNTHVVCLLNEVKLP